MGIQREGRKGKKETGRALLMLGILRLCDWGVFLGSKQLDNHMGNNSMSRADTLVLLPLVEDALLGRSGRIRL